MFEGIQKMILYGLENTIGRYYSRYKAYVYSNEDPKGMNRLQLIIPHINPDVVDETWAYAKNFSGNGYGIHLLPKKGDLVWVEFEFGDLDYPIWSFGYFGENERPEEFSNDEHIGIKTKAGHLIFIDDTQEQEKILIRFFDQEKYIDITDARILIEGNRIELGTDSIEPILKGTTSRNKIDQLMDQVKAISDALVAHTHAGIGSPPANAAAFTNISNQVTTLKNSTNEMLSEKSFTE